MSEANPGRSMRTSSPHFAALHAGYGCLLAWQVSPGLMVRSSAQRCVSNHEGRRSFETPRLRAAPQDEAEIIALRCPRRGKSVSRSPDERSEIRDGVCEPFRNVVQAGRHLIAHIAATIEHTLENLIPGFRFAHPGFCNGPWLVNPFLRCPLAGDLLLYGIGAQGRRLMGFIRGAGRPIYGSVIALSDASTTRMAA